MTDDTSPTRRVAATVGAGLRNAVAHARNAVIESLPGERPPWLVLEMSGGYPARRRRRRWLSPASLLPGEREASQEEFADMVTALLRAPWLEGVVLRFGQLHLGLAAAYALRNQIERLRSGGKQVVALATELTGASYYLATAADAIVAPESAELRVHGLALTTTFLADALGRVGIRFEKLAIDEFKNAGDQLALPAMSAAQRLQYEALLDSIERSYLAAVAARRGATPEGVRGWIDRPVTSAAEARALGMIDRVAYEDEVVGERHRPYAEGARFLPNRTRTFAGGRVAVVSLEGNIVPGKSRRSPIPLPVFGDALAGSETLVGALRTAARDATTAAVVLHVDSGGGSALASDLIWREVTRTAERKPVVAVMGQVAASGGYYVLTHATRVLAAPTTLTGSIGVLVGKFVLEEFNARYGVHPETLRRGRYADLIGSARGWNDAERELLQRSNREIYARFVARVAAGRHLEPARVDEIGRGRVWSGADALEIGLVDELGDVQQAILRAKELAGLNEGAPVWNVPAPRKTLIPADGRPDALLRAWAPLLRERALLLHPAALRVS